MRLWTICIAVIVVILSWLGYSTIHQRSQKLSRISTECTSTFRAQNWIKLESLAREWLTIESVPSAHYWLGIALKEQRHFDEAFHEFDAVSIDGPRGIDAGVEKLEIQFHVHQKPLEAVALAERLLERDKKLASPRRHLIFFHAMMLHRADLIKHVKLAIEYHVDVPEHYVYLLTMEDLGFGDAEEITRKWTEANPDVAEFKKVNTSIRIRTLRANRLKSSPTQEATDKLTELLVSALPELRELGSDPIALDTLLLLAMDDGNLEEAGRLLSLVPDSAANDPCFWRYRGWYAMSTKDLEDADAAYRRALEIHPLGFQTRNEYSNTVRLMGRAEEAANQQSIARVGSELFLEIRRLPHTKNINSALMKRLATYALDCGATDLANGILRQQRGTSYTNANN